LPSCDVCGLDFLLTLVFTLGSLPLSLYTFPFGLRSGLPFYRFPRI